MPYYSTSTECKTWKCAWCGWKIADVGFVLGRCWEGHDIEVKKWQWHSRGAKRRIRGLWASVHVVWRHSLSGVCRWALKCVPSPRVCSFIHVSHSPWKIIHDQPRVTLGSGPPLAMLSICVHSYLQQTVKMVVVWSVCQSHTPHT